MARNIRVIPNAHPGRRGGALVAALFLAGWVLAAWGGCTPARRYKVLTFFFDGVPDPNARPATQPAEGEGTRVVTGRRGETVYLHKPYDQNKCSECHPGSGRTFESFEPVSAVVCAKCHPNVPTQYAFMHGPVAVKQCLLCHQPHEARVEHLLNEAPPKLCMKCHVPGMLASDEAHQDPKRNCLDCHYGHGGRARFFLREPSSTQPAGTQPAASQPAAMRPATTQRAAANSPEAHDDDRSVAGHCPPQITPGVDS